MSVHCRAFACLRMLVIAPEAMAAEMPERVAAAAGATVVSFPWLAAGEAVSALNAAAAVLSAHGEARVAMEPALAEWAGSYRHDFDLAYSDVMTALGGVQEALALRAGAIVDAALGANDAQIVRNNAVES